MLCEGIPVALSFFYTENEEDTKHDKLSPQLVLRMEAKIK